MNQNQLQPGIPGQGPVLVTGATGMLGSCLTGLLLDKGYQVRALYRNHRRLDRFDENLRFYYPEHHRFSGQIDWYEADLLDCSSLLEAIKGISVVFHTAAMVSFDPADRNAMLHNNVHGTANLVNAAVSEQVPRFIHVSSIAALGPSENGKPVDEDCHWIAGKKNSGYSISKFHSEMEVWRGIEEGLQAVIVNPSVILGPGDWKSGSPSFFDSIYKRLKFYPLGASGFVDVRDVARAMLLLAGEAQFKKASGKRYLLNAANLSYQSLFAQMAGALGVAAPSIATRNWMLSAGWRLALLWSKLTGTKPLITKESVSAAAHTVQYSGERIVHDFGFEYRNIESTIAEIATLYLNSCSQSD